MTDAQRLVGEIVTRWETDGGFTDQTVARMGEIARRFARRLEIQGVTRVEEVDEAVCRGFIDAPTRHGE